MVTKITRWSPDTCGCQIEFSWDDAVPQEQRVHSLSNIVQRCTDHQNLADDPAVYNTVTEENPRKNKVLNEILQNAPATWYDILDAESGTRTFKKNIIINWLWNGTAPNRILTITYAGITLTQTQLNTIQSRLDTVFGTGNVFLVEAA